MQLFLDLDGVLADFDAHHEAVFGFRSDKLLDNVDWKAVRATPGFYANIPMMPDAMTLWESVEHLNPIILTGIPHSVEEAEPNKRFWVRWHLGANVEVRCCRSSEKCLYAKPGDVLVDDWDKYRKLWVANGGVWITHTSADNTIEQLCGLGIL